ncbi:MAG: hypothetical protein ABIH82_06060 [Candidatus Woesearchaeota archaeon]
MLIQLESRLLEKEIYRSNLLFDLLHLAEDSVGFKKRGLQPIRIINNDQRYNSLGLRGIVQGEFRDIPVIIIYDRESEVYRMLKY